MFHGAGWGAQREAEDTSFTKAIRKAVVKGAPASLHSEVTSSVGQGWRQETITELGPRVRETRWRCYPSEARRPQIPKQTTRPEGQPRKLYPQGVAEMANGLSVPRNNTDGQPARVSRSTS